MAEKKLHIGCGDRYIPGFIHADIRKLPHVDHVSSAGRLGFCEDSSADLIYACHVLEHFGRHTHRDIWSIWML